MRVVLPALTPPAVARAVATRLTVRGHEPSFSEVVCEANDGLSLNVGRVALTSAPVIAASFGVAFELARRLRDGGPVLLGEGDRAAYRLAWAADAGDAISLAASADEAAWHVASREVWTTESLAALLAARLGRPLRVLRVSDEVLGRFALPAVPPHTLAAHSAPLEPTPAERWIDAVLDAAACVPAPDLRPRELAFARRAS